MAPWLQGFREMRTSGEEVRDTTLTIVTGWADQKHSPHPLREIVCSCQCIGAAPTAQQRNGDSQSAELHCTAGFTHLLWHWGETTPELPCAIAKQNLMPSCIGRICRVIFKALWPARCKEVPLGYLTPTTKKVLMPS